MKKSEYHEYLASPAWKKRRDAAVNRAGGRCQLCNASKSLNVHHRTYKYVGNERPGDLTVLCRSCHETFHGLLPAPPSELGVRQGASRTKVPHRGRMVTRPLNRAEQDDLINAILETSLFHYGYFTAKEMALLVNETPQRVGTALGKMRERKLVRRNKKRWNKAHGLYVQAVSARAAAKREAA